MLVFEQEMSIPKRTHAASTLQHLGEQVQSHLADNLFPLRFVITASASDEYQCEVAVLADVDRQRMTHDSIFRFVRRGGGTTNQFNVVLVVPTGIGAEIGGHAGDACPVALLMASICDTLVTHPNVVNASDINEIPRNALYVEGSVLTRLLMGTAGLQPVRANRVLVIIDEHQDELFVHTTVNAVSAGRAVYGLNCAGVVCLDPPVKLRSRFASSGRAAGRVENLEGLCAVLDERRGQYDAVSISSVIDVPREFHMAYFEAEGNMVNPWGGVEAMLTHTLTGLYGVPTAHSPMNESLEIANEDPGFVDPRMAAEAVSETFMQCTLKGLARSPRIITDVKQIREPGVFSVEDVSCLVIPDGCLGLPTLAAVEQGIPVIAVRENRNVMRNDLSALPWAAGQFHRVENYWEATGVLAALKAGIAPESVRRPFPHTIIERRKVEPALSDFSSVVLRKSSTQ